MVEIREITKKSDLRKFINFSDKLYKGYKNYVPELKADEMNMLLKDKNAAFEYCDAKYFLAYKNNKLVGKTAAIVSHEANKKWETGRMRFSRLEFIDDKEVSAALIDAVENWAKELELNEIHGPLGFSDLDKEGMQVEGFEYEGLTVTYNNYPYLNEHLEALGYKKDIDWIEYRIQVPKELTEKQKRLERLSQIVLKRNHLKLFNIKKISDAEPIVIQIFTLLNECYKNLYGVVPFSEKQAEEYYQRFKPLLNPNYAKFILDENDKLMGFGLAAPSLAKAMQKARGRMLPFGFIHLMRAIKNSKSLELLLVAVHPDYQNKGLTAVLLNEISKNAMKNGIEYAESGPELETNEKVQQLWKFYDTIQHKRRRCYVKKF